MERLERFNRRVGRGLVVVGGACLVAMCLLTCTNIVLRLTWVPVRGAYELMGLLGAVVAAFALGHTQMRRGHVAVDILVTGFPPGVRRWLQAFNGLVCMGFFLLAAWQLVDKALVLIRTGEVTETLRVVYYPFTLAAALGCAALALVLLADFFAAVGGEGREVAS